MAVVFRLAVLCCLGCGRIAFDPGSDARSGNGDGSPDAIAMPAPIAWWPFDEATGSTAADTIGNADGTLQAGTSTNPTWTAGHTASALAFAGDGDGVSLGFPPSLANLPTLTVTAWIRPATVTAGPNWRCVFDKGNITVAGWAFVVARNGNGTLEFVGFFGPQQMERTSVADVLVVGTWQHVALTWDGSGMATGVRLYVNGAEVAYASGVDVTNARGDDSAVLANINCNSSAGLAGAIDDVKIYDRVLTPAQLATLP